MLAITTLLLCLGAGPDDLRCLTDESDPSGEKVFYSHLQQQAYTALDRRDKAFEDLTTAASIEARQKEMRAFFIQQLGGFPDVTPLKAEVVGKIDCDGYHIEKVIYSSQPFHRVTANLYLPDGAKNCPGVVVASGHSRTGKTADYNQRFALAMVQNGIAALVYDPIGQGERSQMLDEKGEPQFGSTTSEHFLMGVGSILVGTNTARYRVWDAMSSINYLASREEIDHERIGFTGCSGGGTLTSYVMALDGRVKCAAPSCYLTTFRRLVETIGPQDSEQNIFGQIEFGMDHPDYVLMTAPRPVIISATTSDFFDISGTWANYRQAKRLYTRLGVPEQVGLVEGDGKHGVPLKNLTAITRWMRRWLLDKDDAIELGELKTLPPADLLCTDKGQVLLSLDREKTVFELNQDRNKQFAQDRERLWENEAAALNKVREISRVPTLDKVAKLTMKKRGRVQRDGYHIDKLVLYTDDGFPIPTLTYHPEDPAEEVYLYLHEEGKHTDGTKDGPIEKLVDEGYVVVAVDLAGMGETATGNRDKLLGDWKTYYLNYLLGKSFVGVRTEQAIACAQWASNYETKKPRTVHLVGVGAATIPALHAAALEQDLIATTTLRKQAPSWTDVVNSPAAAGQLDNAIHGALRFYDTTDLAKAIEKTLTVE
jgi:dienelactone hydrolase